ncbi:uncharacterized protein V1518DRAFT_419763 [Limtongia smithiae]|uniref:uncharacterized protein n=1 Tax=Limtongia smithiae TaxID=1125753 RepID=UPI0034CF931C
MPRHSLSSSDSSAEHDSDIETASAAASDDVVGASADFKDVELDDNQLQPLLAAASRSTASLATSNNSSRGGSVFDTESRGGNSTPVVAANGNELTDKMMKQLLEVFQRLGNKDGDREYPLMPVSKLGTLMQIFGFNPTDAELAYMVADAGFNKDMDFLDVAILFARKMRDTDVEDEMRLAFKTYAGSSDGIMPNHFKGILESVKNEARNDLGSGAQEAITVTTRIDNLIAEMSQRANPITYEEFREMMLRSS